jgi:heme-degrading monooxygenase HmoA
MYISRSIITLQDESERELIEKVDEVHASRQTADGFRWSMLLRSAEDPSSFVSVSMWLTAENEEAWREANGAPLPPHRYDVATARGSMTPASSVAIVDWQVEPDLAARFAARWNAAYHAIEDKIGSRLLQDLGSETTYAGLHVATDPAALDPKVLSAGLTDDEGLEVTPLAVEFFDVVLLTEA